MKKKKFLDGTELGSQNESATKTVTAPGGAETGFVEVDGNDLASVAGGYGVGFDPALVKAAIERFISRLNLSTSEDTASD